MGENDLIDLIRTDVEHRDLTPPPASAAAVADPNMFCERHMLYPEPYTLADHLVDWAYNDNRLHKWRPKPTRRCGICRER